MLKISIIGQAMIFKMILLKLIGYLFNLQVFLLSDVLYAYLRYEYHLVNGLAPKTKDGKEGTVIMQ